MALNECLCCGIELEDIMEPEDNYPIQPADGTAFTSAGHYGSIFDPPLSGSDYLQIVICNDCLTQKASRVTYVKPKFIPAQNDVVAQWNPQGDPYNTLNPPYFTG